MTDVLAVAEHRRGDLRDVSLEVVTAGRELVDAIDGNLHVAVVGGDVASFADDLNVAGVSTVHTVAYGEEYNHDVHVQALEAIVADLDPAYVLAPNSVSGLDYAPALATVLDAPLVTDAIAFDAGDDDVSITREFNGGKTEGSLEVASTPAVVSTRPTEWQPTTDPGDATIESVEVDIDEPAIKTDVTGYEEVVGGDVDITDADVIVSIGRGIEEEENLHLVEELADALGATLAASRPIVDNEWLPKNRQVGQSGKVVTPEIYLAIGISGATQHVAGMKGADTIIAINDDPSAPIFEIADYGIVDDLFDVVPLLTESFS